MHVANLLCIAKPFVTFIPVHAVAGCLLPKCPTNLIFLSASFGYCTVLQFVHANEGKEEAHSYKVKNFVSACFYFPGIGSDAVSVASGVTVKFTCTGPADSFLPTWLVNGTPVVSSGNICYRSTSRRNPGELNATVTLTINGNRTCNTFDIYCRIFKGVHLYVHNTTLVVQG